MPKKSVRKIYSERKSLLAEKIHPCYIIPSIKSFKSSARRCKPTAEQACAYEKLNITQDADQFIPAEIQRASGHKWKFLGSGVHRKVYEHKPGCVIKLGMPRKEVGYTGEEANAYEVGSYNIAKAAVKQFLVPVVAHSPSFKWIIAPAAEDESKIGYSKMSDLKHTLQYELDRANADCRDLHSGNIGMLEGKPVILDYGFGVQCDIARPPRRKDITLGKFLPKVRKRRVPR